MEAFISSKEKSERIMRIKSKVPVVMGKASCRGDAAAEQQSKTSLEAAPEAPRYSFLWVQGRSGKWTCKRC